MGFFEHWLPPQMGPPKKPIVAVFDADLGTSLAFVRTLGRAGVPVHVFSHKALSATRWSRYASFFSRCPDPNDASAFQRWLRKEVDEGRIDLVAPTSDTLAYHLAECASDATERMRRAMPPPDQVRAVLFKDRFAQACARLGIDTPRTLAPLSPEEVAEAASTLRYPVLIKPRSHVGGVDERGEVARTPEELRTLCRPVDASRRPRWLVERHPELRWPVVQEYVRGGWPVYSVSGVLAADGVCLSVRTSRKLAQWHPVLGIGILFERHHDPELQERGVAIARRLLGRGLFEIEFVREEGGRLLALDLNPRAHGPIAFDVARGSNLPLLWYQEAIGEAPHHPGDDVELIWTLALLFHIGQLLRALRGPRRAARLRTYARHLARRRVDAAHDLGDPLASLLFDLLLLRHRGGLVRPFLVAPPIPDYEA